MKKADDSQQFERGRLFDDLAYSPKELVVKTNASAAKNRSDNHKTNNSSSNNNNNNINNERVVCEVGFFCVQRGSIDFE